MKKLLTKTVSAMTVFFTLSILCIAFLFPAGTAFASSATCFDISGHGSPVMVNGVANSGVIYFGFPNAPSAEYQACVEDPLNDNLGPFIFKGWAWDDNLGWISFYCGDEDLNPATPNTNLGIKCGDYTYGVWMSGPNQPDPGIFHDYAFGDATGYISFNCEGPGTCPTIPYATKIETQGFCAGSIYGVNSPDPANCVPHANDWDYIYAWSDNVGWFNMAAQYTPELIPPEVAATLEVTEESGGSGDVTLQEDPSHTPEFPWVILIGLGVDMNLNISPDPANPGLAPYATDPNGYSLILTILNKKTGAALTEPGKYSFTPVFDWSNYIDANQTDGGPVSGDAVTLPDPDSNFNMNTYDVVSKAITGPVTSVAPSSDMNKTGDFSNLTFIYPKVDSPPPTEESYLKFNKMEISMIYDKGSPPANDNLCVFGKRYTCEPKHLISEFEKENLNFKPPVQLTEFDDMIGKTALSLRNGVASSLVATLSTLCVTCVDIGGIAADIVLGIDGEPDWKLVKEIYDPENPDADPLDFPSLFSVQPGMTTFQVGAVCTNPRGCLSFGDGAYAWSIVRYAVNGLQVLYYGNKLPREAGTLIVNPVAKIIGSIYSTGFSNPSSETVVRSLGNVSTNILRDTIFKNVSNIIAGKTLTPGHGTITGWDLGGFVATHVLSLMPDSAGIPKVYYFSGGDLDIKSAGDISWTGDRTIIVVGGNVFIDSNLYNAGVSPTKPRLGLIVLKDLAHPERNDGNIYVSPDVTNIQANIFADGSLFSVSSTENRLTTGAHAGLPYFTDEGSRMGLLQNQLYIEGSLASLNTIGGATPDIGKPPILGDGSIADNDEGNYGNDPRGRSEARLYDLNFMRYYGFAYERRPADDPNCPGQAIIDQQNPTFCPSTSGYKLTAQPLSKEGDLVLNAVGKAAKPYDTKSEIDREDYAGSLLITFDPPPASLPGFSVTTGAEETIRP